MRGGSEGYPSVPVPLPSHLTPRQYLSWSASHVPHRRRFSRALEYFASSVENGGFVAYSDTRPEIWGARYTIIMSKGDTQKDTNTTTSNEKATWVSVACSQKLFSLLRWSSARTEIKPGRRIFWPQAQGSGGWGKEKKIDERSKRNPRQTWTLNATSRIPDSRNYYRFQPFSAELGYWIPIVSGIPDSLRCIPHSKAQDSRFYKQKFPWFRNPIPLTWGDLQHDKFSLTEGAVLMCISATKAARSLDHSSYSRTKICKRSRQTRTRRGLAPKQNETEVIQPILYGRGRV